MDKTKQELADKYKAMGSLVRLNMLELLRDKSLNVQSICTRLGITASRASKELTVLRLNNVVRSESVGTSQIYSLVSDNLSEAMDIMESALQTE